MGEWVVQAVIEGAWRPRGWGPTAPVFGHHRGVRPQRLRGLHYRDNAPGSCRGTTWSWWDCWVPSTATTQGDITRTFPVSGRFSGEQRDLYDVVEGGPGPGRPGVRPWGHDPGGSTTWPPGSGGRGLSGAGAPSPGTVDDVPGAAELHPLLPPPHLPLAGTGCPRPRGLTWIPPGTRSPWSREWVLTVEAGAVTSPREAPAEGPPPSPDGGSASRTTVLVTRPGRGEILGPGSPPPLRRWRRWSGADLPPQKTRIRTACWKMALGNPAEVRVHQPEPELGVQCHHQSPGIPSSSSRKSPSSHPEPRQGGVLTGMVPG